MIKVSTTGMAVSLKTDLRFPISGQWGHGDRIIQLDNYFHYHMYYSYAILQDSTYYFYRGAYGKRNNFNRQK